MGFMSGLAEGFGTQITAGQTRKAQKERDALSMAMDRWNKRTEEYRNAETTDKKLQTAAQQIAKTNGLPEGAWVDIYGRLQGGDTFTGAEKWATAQEWSVEEQTPAMPDGPATPAGPTPPTAQDDQMAASGLAPGQENTPGQQDPGILGSMAGELGGVLATAGNPQAQQDRLIQGANDQATAGLGISPEDQAKYEAGYQPNVPASGVTYKPAVSVDTPELKPSDAVWLEINGKWAQGYATGPGKAFDLSGNPVEATNVRTNEQFTQIRNVLNSIPNADKLMDEKASAITLVENVGTLTTMASENPNVLTRAVALSTGLNEITNEFNSFMSQLDALSQSGQVMPDAEMEAKESQLSDTLTAALEAEGTNPSDAQRFAALAIGVKFDLARTMNGSGTLSEADRAAGAEALSTNDPAIFLQIAQDLAKKSMASVNNKVRQTAGSPQARSAMSIEGVDLGTLFEPVEASLSPESQSWLKQPSAAPAAGAPTTPDAPANPQQQGQPIPLDDATAAAFAEDGYDLTQFIGTDVYLVGRDLYTADGVLIEPNAVEEAPTAGMGPRPRQ